LILVSWRISIVPRNASQVRSRLPPPPLLLPPLVVPVPLVPDEGSLIEVSPPPVVVPDGDEVVPEEELLDPELPLAAAIFCRQDADCIATEIELRLHAENWLLKLMVGAIR
jgi:hypothetical protein